MDTQVAEREERLSALQQDAEQRALENAAQIAASAGSA